MPVKTGHAVAHRILRWFDANARTLPWRNPPGRPLPTDDLHWPYRVWLSEIMLQQTTVAAAAPYFQRFTARWPGVADLAAAEDGEVMQAWAGLGYYARARNLLACARAVTRDHGGRFPDDEATLRTLPGIGAYTAAAIAAFAFGKRAVVIDGNIERVTARLFAIKTALPAARILISARMNEVTPDTRAGDFAQGCMDLARAICTPRAPKCLICPVSAECLGRATPEAYPVKAAKPVRPERHGTAWWIERGGQVLLVRRPARGLLGGMLGLPSDGWEHAVKPLPFRGGVGGGAAVKLGGDEQPHPNPSPEGEGLEQLGTVTHVFTHFRLTLDVIAIAPENSCATKLDGEWWPVEQLDQAGLPSLFAKAARLARAREDTP